MIRYILIGGYPWKALDGGKAFAEALVGAPNKPTSILICLFARDEVEWPQAFKDDVAKFQALLPNRQLQFSLASKDKFTDQVSQSDVIYLRGGSTTQLISALTPDPTWMEKLDGKTLAGTSAGADAISTYFYALDNPRIEHGLGLLPVKVLVHYESDYANGTINWREAYKALEDYRETIEMIPIREGEFVVRERP